MADTTTELVPAEQTTALTVNGFADNITRHVSEDGYFATFSTEDMAGRRKLFNSTQSAKLLRDFMNTPIELSDIVFAPTTITDEEGFSQTIMGCYLIDTDGTSYVSSSQGVCKSAATILAQLGAPADWDGPLTVMCCESNTARGRRFKSLRLC